MHMHVVCMNVQSVGRPAARGSETLSSEGGGGPSDLLGGLKTCFGGYGGIETTTLRYGSTDEVGVFEMVDSGMKPVASPSALFMVRILVKRSWFFFFFFFFGTFSVFSTNSYQSASKHYALASAPVQG